MEIFEVKSFSLYSPGYEQGNKGLDAAARDRAVQWLLPPFSSGDHCVMPELVSALRLMVSSDLTFEFTVNDRVVASGQIEGKDKARSANAPSFYAKGSDGFQYSFHCCRK